MSANGVARFGLMLPNRNVLYGMPVDVLYRATEVAEASDFFDSVWIGDNLLARPRMEAVVTLSAIAARSRRVRLGVRCLASFPLRDPVLFAVQWASLDVLSGGRTALAVCLGGFARMGRNYEIEALTMGVQDRERVPRLVEGIEILRLLWGPGPVSYEGRFTSFEDVDLQPKPVQPRVPIIIAVSPPLTATREAEDRALRRVARYSDGWTTDVLPVDVFRRRWDRIRELAAEYGRAEQVVDASFHLMANLNEDREAAYADTVAYMRQYYRDEFKLTPDEVGSSVALGSPDIVAARINDFIEAGGTTAIIRFPSLEQEIQLERFLEHVAPQFQPTVGASSAGGPGRQ
jgi:alkanesulfonate monooxygenase SsuD/methylene tetrahydromethanopterin reductase-like flavin-dependent oxidoreductase (luciferase family)